MANIEHTFERIADSGQIMKPANGRSKTPTSDKKDFTSARHAVWRELSVIREAARPSQPGGQGLSKEPSGQRTPRPDSSNK